MEKYLVKMVTPSTSARKKRCIDSVTAAVSSCSLTDDDEGEELSDDNNYDLCEQDLIECTQAYDDDEKRYPEEDDDDGLTQPHDFTQELDDDDDSNEEPRPDGTDLTQQDPQQHAVGVFPKDTEQQVSIDCDGILRIFKLGESFTAKFAVKALCRNNSLPVGVLADAVYTIRKFDIDKKSMIKYAECRVRIPLYYCFPHPTERERVRRSDGDIKVTLRWSENIRLRDLDRHVDEHVPPLEQDLLYSAKAGAKHHIFLGELATRRVPFHIPSLDGSFTVLEMFAGAGGMSLGFKNAGFDVRWMIEKDGQAAATLRVNHTSPKEEAIVFEETVDNFLRKAQGGKKGYPKPYQVHHIHASSPCQGYSTANRIGGKNDHNNNMQAFEWIRYLQYFQPETASFENVTGMLTKTGRDNGSNISYWQRLLSELLLEAGYQFRAKVIRASEYGDPQNRDRLFIIAAKRGRRLPDFPGATHGEDPIDKDLKPVVTVEQALGDLASVEPEAEGENGLVELPNGKLTTDHSIAGRQAIKSESKKLIANKPAHTVMKANGIEHYEQERNLTVREKARLQSFPDDYLFCGSATQKNNQIGNAVPVNLATAIAEMIRLCYI